MKHCTHPRSLACLFALVLTGATSQALVGCTSDHVEDAPTMPVTTARSSIARDASPTLSDDERVTFAVERADFAADLFRKVVATAPDANVLVSPHSASIALAMTYAGSGGATKRAMASALRFSLPEERTHAAFNATDLALATRQHAADPARPSSGAVELASANSLWTQTRDRFDGAYLDTLARHYGSGVNLVDFVAGDGEPARVTINGWVSERTREKIPELLAEGSLRRATWVLVNALSMKASWQHPFDKVATSDGRFRTVAGASVTASMMRQQATLRAVHGETYDAVELPYDGGELAMVAVVPAAGTFDAWRASFTGRVLLDLPLSDNLVALTMPKFEVKPGASPPNITGPLAELGMPQKGQFPGGADEIAVIQQTYLAADEAGTEAATATAVIGAPSSLVDPPKTLTISLDRPFLYAIVDKPTGAILFLGQVVDPTRK